MRNIDRIYIHCSASKFGTVDLIREWHLERNFDDIGYHYVILNPYATYKQWLLSIVKFKVFSSINDGKIMEGRSVDIVGAHVAGDNKTSIGVCYVGDSPTVNQYFSMIKLCKSLIEKYQIPKENVFGHNEYYSNNGMDLKKTCPNFDMDTFRWLLASFI